MVTSFCDCMSWMAPTARSAPSGVSNVHTESVDSGMDVLLTADDIVLLRSFDVPPRTSPVPGEAWRWSAPTDSTVVPYPNSVMPREPRDHSFPGTGRDPRRRPGAHVGDVPPTQSPG